MRLQYLRDKGYLHSVRMCLCTREELSPMILEISFYKINQRSNYQTKTSHFKKCISDMKIVGTDLNLRSKVDLQKTFLHTFFHTNTQLTIRIHFFDLRVSANLSLAAERHYSIIRTLLNCFYAIGNCIVSMPSAHLPHSFDLCHQNNVDWDPDSNPHEDFSVTRDMSIFWL